MTGEEGISLIYTSDFETPPPGKLRWAEFVCLESKTASEAKFIFFAFENVPGPKWDIVT